MSVVGVLIKFLVGFICPILISVTASASTPEDCAKALVEGPETDKLASASAVPNYANTYKSVRRWISNGQFQRAHETNEQILLAFPESPIALIYRAAILKSQGEIDQAEKIVAGLTTESFRSAIKMDYVADLLFEMGWKDKAFELYQGVLKLDPEHRGAWVAISLLHHQNGRLEEFLDELKQVVEKNPYDEIALRNLTKTLVRFERAAEVIEIMDGLLRKYPQHPQAQKRKLTALVALKQWDLAVAVGAKAVELNPDSIGAHGEFAMALIKQGRLDRAAAVILRAEELGWKNGVIRSSLTYALIDQKQWAAALESSQIYLRSRPLEHSMLVRQKLILNNLGRYGESLIVAQKLVELRPDFDRHWADVARLYLKLQNYPKAIEAADQALALNPNNTLALNIKASILFSERDFNTAMSFNQRSLRVNSESPHAWGLRARLLFQFRRPEEALDALNREVALQPRYKVHVGFRLQVMVVAGRYDQALTLVRTLPTGSQKSYHLARIYGAKGLWKEALLVIDKCTDGAAKFRYKAEILYNLGQKKASIASLIQLLHLSDGKDYRALAAVIKIQSEAKIPRSPIVQNWINSTDVHGLTKIAAAQESMDWSHIVSPHDADDGFQ